MHYEFIDLSQDGGVALLRLNRPDNLNAWNQQMRDELRDAVNTLGGDDALRAERADHAVDAGFDGHDAVGRGMGGGGGEEPGTDEAEDNGMIHFRDFVRSGP